MITHPSQDRQTVMSIARVRTSDHATQELSDHLIGVGRRAATYAAKLGLEWTGFLSGVLHDAGKYSEAFGRYLRVSAGLVEQTEGDTDHKDEPGRVDHSTSGAQLAFEMLAGDSSSKQIAREAVALTIASHHMRTGLLDVLIPNSTSVHLASDLERRLQLPLERTHLDEVKRLLDPLICRMLEENEVAERATKEWESARNALQRISEPKPRLLNLGLFVRFLFSCVIDADRSDSADFESPDRRSAVFDDAYPSWDQLIGPLEDRIASFPLVSPLDRIRSSISDQCLGFSSRDPGLYYLPVPTGGGKTLSSLRFALHHAKRKGLDRVVYVLPYTSIIDQNAAVVRDLYSGLAANGLQVVLEHHSNLAADEDTDQARLMAENWDAPIIFTTMVQFLDTFFAAGTQAPRRLHRLVRSVIVFDEIQALPILTTHLFNNCVRFLTEIAGSTVLLSTATQPLLHSVDPQQGALVADPRDGRSSIVAGVEDEFRLLRRTNVLDMTNVARMSHGDVAELARRHLVADYPSVLVVANTKRSALEIFKAAERLAPEADAFHLSTSMCPAHRRDVVRRIRANLDLAVPTICVSTQVIEAGVDIDFGAVVRALAGLDSIAQAAGRCNRHAERSTGSVYVVYLAEEKLGNLRDIRDGIEATKRVLCEFHEDPALFNNDILSFEAMERFYKYYFHLRRHLMEFPISSTSDLGRDDSILELLSTNARSKEHFQRMGGHRLPFLLPQSFATAAGHFAAIETNTRSVLVQYEQQGRDLISALAGTYDPGTLRKLMREGQQYTVSLPTSLFEELTEARTFPEVRPGLGVYYAPPNYYGETGLTLSQESTLWA